jgi:hypothetical protein
LEKYTPRVIRNQGIPLKSLLYERYLNRPAIAYFLESDMMMVRNMIDDDEIYLKTAPQVWQKNLKQFLRMYIYRKV